ncbi:MAG: large conductance mechanosensitive channel protein MscL [bacterium]|nr:large conductance mechanosensitive channel protein MscL [bacterium]
MDGFKKFLLRGNVVDLAVGVVVGSAFTGIVNAFVKDLLTPLIGAIGGNHDFSNLYFTLNNSKFMYGDFINALISFIIVASVVYFFVVLPMNRLIARADKKKETPPSKKKCPECISEIPFEAKRCAFCTGSLS